MEEKLKLENPEKKAKMEVQDEALDQINGGGLSAESGKKANLFKVPVAEEEEEDDFYEFF